MGVDWSIDVPKIGGSVLRFCMRFCDSRTEILVDGDDGDGDGDGGEGRK